MNWINLDTGQIFQDLLLASDTTPQVIFKHSTRCGTSAFALEKLENDFKTVDSPLSNWHYVDVLRWRAVSNQIAGYFQVTHQSPQVLVISKRKCVYTTSHSAIRYPVIMDAIRKCKQ